MEPRCLRERYQLSETIGRKACIGGMQIRIDDHDSRQSAFQERRSSMITVSSLYDESTEKPNRNVSLALCDTQSTALTEQQTAYGGSLKLRRRHKGNARANVAPRNSPSHSIDQASRSRGFFESVCCQQRYNVEAALMGLCDWTLEALWHSKIAFHPWQSYLVISRPLLEDLTIIKRIQLFCQGFSLLTKGIIERPLFRVFVFHIKVNSFCV